MRTLLTKFKQCFDLYSVSRPLCRHEVVCYIFYIFIYLSIRCARLGLWFPVQFPSTSIIPKFHVLTYHIRQKAQLRRTVGMEAEHSSETTHSVINSLNRTYHTVQNLTKRMELAFKVQCLRSNSTLKNYRKPLKRLKGKKQLSV